jgi:competence protein ComEC
MQHSTAPIYVRVPLLRILLWFIAGILLQFHLKLSLQLCLVTALLGLLLFIVFNYLSLTIKFRYSWLSGMAIILLFVGVGGITAYQKNIEHHAYWLGKWYTPGAALKITLIEDLQAKPNSYKAEAAVDAIKTANNWQPVKGTIILYFKKDSVKPTLSYGNQIIINTNLQRVINAGNPGGFNYAQYCAFQQIHYQVFLNNNSFILTQKNNANTFSSFILRIRNKVLYQLQTYIPNKQALSIAEALFIGYREDLDRDVVQSYSNTGVVHIIAISGLHLGMIYLLVVKLLSFLPKGKLINIIRPVFIILTLWLFALTAGAAPSILRSALMFSCIVIGNAINRKNSIYNSLVVSAFILLLINPFNLWNVGFQLSYTAVLSIILFQPVIAKALYSNYTIINKIWALMAVTLAAQILTLPIVIYHFHQFPLLFLITNIVAVPLAAIILYAHILLLIFSWLPLVAKFIGLFIQYCILFLNNYIHYFNSFKWVVWPSLQITIVQACLLYALIIAFVLWLYYKQLKYLLFCLTSMFLLAVTRTVDFIEKNHQHKLIVYNVPKHTAIDLVEGRNYQFIGDSILTVDGFLRNFHIKPSRVLHRILPVNMLSSFSVHKNLISSGNKKILVLDSSFVITKANESEKKLTVDLIILTKNPKIYLNKLHTYFNCKQYVFDSSNPFWKVNYWKKDADSLHLRHHATATQGAFVMDF